MKNCHQRKDKVGKTGGRVHIGALFAKTVQSTAMSATPGATYVNETAPGGFESWNEDSGATEHMTPDGTALMDYKPAAPGDMVEVADRTFVPVQGYGRLELELQQPGGIKTATLKKRRPRVISGT